MSSEAGASFGMDAALHGPLREGVKGGAAVPEGDARTRSDEGAESRSALDARPGPCHLVGVCMLDTARHVGPSGG